jgi:hypothetical protein
MACTTGTNHRAHPVGERDVMAAGALGLRQEGAHPRQRAVGGGMRTRKTQAAPTLTAPAGTAARQRRGAASFRR